MITKIEPTIELFRYDINRPPTSWNADYQSTETEYANCQGKGKKNLAQLYFFSDNLQLTKDVAKKSCQKLEKESCWISSTKTKEELKVLDFSKCKNIHDVLCILDDLGLNIYDNQMVMHSLKNLKFKSLENHTLETRLFPNFPELFDVSYFGQALTDFENGKIFRNLILELKLDIDGYRWYENPPPSGMTYCLFESEKIENSKQQEYNLD